MVSRTWLFCLQKKINIFDVFYPFIKQCCCSSVIWAALWSDQIRLPLLVSHRSILAKKTNPEKWSSWNKPTVNINLSINIDENLWLALTFFSNQTSQGNPSLLQCFKHLKLSLMIKYNLAWTYNSKSNTISFLNNSHLDYLLVCKGSFFLSIRCPCYYQL